MKAKRYTLEVRTLDRLGCGMLEELLYDACSFLAEKGITCALSVSCDEVGEDTGDACEATSKEAKGAN